MKETKKLCCVIFKSCWKLKIILNKKVNTYFMLLLTLKAFRALEVGLWKVTNNWLALSLQEKKFNSYFVNVHTDCHEFCIALLFWEILWDAYKKYPKTKEAFHHPKTTLFSKVLQRFMQMLFYKLLFLCQFFHFFCCIHGYSSWNTVKTLPDVERGFLANCT